MFARFLSYFIVSVRWVYFLELVSYLCWMMSLVPAVKTLNVRSFIFVIHWSVPACFSKENMLRVFLRRVTAFFKFIRQQLFVSKVFLSGVKKYCVEKLFFICVYAQKKQFHQRFELLLAVINLWGALALCCHQLKPRSLSLFIIVGRSATCSKITSGLI